MTTLKERDFQAGYIAFTPTGNAIRSCPFIWLRSKTEWFDGWHKAETDYEKKHAQVENTDIFTELKQDVETTFGIGCNFERLDWATKAWVVGLCRLLEKRFNKLSEPKQE